VSCIREDGIKHVLEPFFDKILVCAWTACSDDGVCDVGMHLAW